MRADNSDGRRLFQVFFTNHYRFPREKRYKLLAARVVLSLFMGILYRVPGLCVLSAPTLVTLVLSCVEMDVRFLFQRIINLKKVKKGLELNGLVGA